MNPRFTIDENGVGIVIRDTTDKSAVCYMRPDGATDKKRIMAKIMADALNTEAARRAAQHHKMEG
jgi:hypothetical protein